jgi:hypothetical protein
MPGQNDAHNLLIVSDLHIAEGLRAEAGECCYGLDAYLYDGAFARFLRYHEQMRRDAGKRQNELKQARKRGEPVDEAAERETALLTHPWRLVLAGDVFDFWDVVHVPGDANSLQAALDDQIRALGPQSPAGLWLRELKMRLSAVQAGLEVSAWDYDTVWARLEALSLDDGRQRRAVEDLTWWTEVLVLKQARLPRQTRRHGLGTTWQEVVWKLTHIYRGHTEFFGALAWFIACGNDIVLLKGNHDIELHWPQVHDGHLPHLLADAYSELRDGGTLSPAFGAYPPELLVDINGKPLPEGTAFRQLLPTYDPQGKGAAGGKRFVFEDWYYCEPDLVYVEHGNQYEPADSSARFLEPTMPSDPSRIELPWGAFMVRYFYNKIVTVHPFAVNVKPEQEIIHWMTHHDLFRLLGIILAELIDIARGLLRAVKQGFQGTWIRGDHSISGLIPLLIYDVILIRIWVDKWWRQRRSAPATAAAGKENPASQREIESLSARTLLHLGALGTVLCLLLGGAGWLFGWTWTDRLALPLALSAALVIAGAAWSVRLGREKGQHGLGELLLQVGVVGAVAVSITSLSAGLVLGWSLAVALLIISVCLVAAAAGAWLIWRTRSGERRLFRGTWLARCLRSGASLWLELGLLATVAGAYYQFGEADTQLAWAWLRAGLALFVAAWSAYRVHGRYVNQRRPASRSGGLTVSLPRGIRNVCTVLVALLAVGLVLPPLAWVVGASIQILFAGGGSEEVVSVAGFANWLYDAMTSRDVFGMPLLVVLVLAMAAVILVESGAQWLVERWRNRQLRPRTSWTPRRRARPAPTAMPLALTQQRAEIEELARAEQRRWLDSLLGMLTLFLPVVSLVLLAVAIAGGLAALLNFVNPFLKAVEPLKALGISALFGLGYGLLRQLSATRQRHDPRSGFGDLFYRMAGGIAGILAATEDWPGPSGLGRPRYFVFGHDHWADSKPLPGRGRAERDKSQQWYVNSGTWLRGYIEEQRQQEVNENHSTFVQIIPGLGEDEAPRVLRWNDGANQPEHIVRREEPASTSVMIWDRWEGGWAWVLVWALLLAITWRLAPPCWMTRLWPLVWTLGLWLASWFLVQATRWLVEGAGGWLRKSPQRQPAPDPQGVTDIHCHVGLLGDKHPEWGQMSPSYQEQPVFKAMLIYGRLDEDEVCDATLRTSTEEAIAGSHVGHVVCLALDPVYDLEGTQHKDLSHVWVANEYILELQKTLGGKVLLGASVHPFDPAFKERVVDYVNKGAVLLKWLPSAQQIDLAHSKVRDALEFLATARNGKPLPLLLHIGPEYAIPSMDPRTASYDYLTWTWMDELRNRWRSADDRLYPVKKDKIRANLQAGLDAGAVIIFAHCGLPYFAPRRLRRFLEHSELRTIRRYLKGYPAGRGDGKGRCYADVSALITPFRRSYFPAIRRLPPQSLLFGSDFPTPVFELSAGLGEVLQDLAAALEGELERVLVPEDNLIDVNYRELQHIFPGHPMFRNFEDLLR